MYNVILFNDLLDFPVIAKTAGPYRVASTLRNNGYTTKVFDHFAHFLESAELLSIYMDSVDRCVGEETFLIGISTTWLNFRDSNMKNRFGLFLKLLRKKYKNVHLIFGGNTSNSKRIFEEFKNDVDYWINGLGETAIIKLCEKICAGEKFSKKEIVIDPLSMQFDFHNSKPMYEVDDDIIMEETLPFELSRGCRFKCKFCAYPLLGRSPKDHQYIRSEASVREELQFNYEHFKIRNYFMVCDTFNETTEKLRKVQRAAQAAKVDINFSAYIRLDLLHAHPEQIDILKDLGIRTAFFGIESLHDPSAKAVGKGMGRKRIYQTLEKVHTVWGNDVLLHGNFIFGLPYETEQTASQWANELVNRELPLHSWRIDTLQIHPGRLIHSSEFEKNIGKYGYTLDGSLWKNAYWNKDEANNLARHFMKEADSNNVRGVSSWIGMALRNYNWDINKIKSVRAHEVDNEEFQQARLDYLRRYISLIR